MENKEFFEECLRKLMVIHRPKVESRKTFNMDEVLFLLKKVQKYSNITNDIRFIDCVQYFDELGVKL